jgi:hypothetical protein
MSHLFVSTGLVKPIAEAVASTGFVAAPRLRNASRRQGRTRVWGAFFDFLVR